MTTQIHQLEIIRNLSSPWFSLGSVGCFEMFVPGHKVGLIIGKGGETIKQLQERSGAKIIIIQDSAELANEKPLRITGDPNGVETAKQLVTEILNQNDERDMGGAGFGRGRGPSSNKKTKIEDPDSAVESLSDVFR